MSRKLFHFYCKIEGVNGSWYLHLRLDLAGLELWLDLETLLWICLCFNWFNTNTFLRESCLYFSILGRRVTKEIFLILRIFEAQSLEKMFMFMCCTNVCIKINQFDPILDVIDVWKHSSFFLCCLPEKFDFKFKLFWFIF